MYIDSTVAELWLPEPVCSAFEDAFGLQYDNFTGLYLVDDNLHKRLLAENPSVSFFLGQKYSTNATINITFPYSAFDLQASPPYKGLQNVTNYFPIRRATKENQFVLGRTFLQESYLTVDWERQNFSISACNWGSDLSQKQIVPIISPQYTGERNKSSSLATGAIIGIALGAGFAVVIMAVGAFFFFRRRRQQRKKLERIDAQYAAQAAATKESSSEKVEEHQAAAKTGDEGTTNVFPKAELPADSSFPPRLSTDGKADDEESPTSLGIPSPLAEVENNERQIFEMEGDTPNPAEAGGRQLSEKETMMVRERIYNGVDPNGGPDVSPMSEEAPPHRLAPVSPSEVAMVNRRLPVSPVTSVTPRTPRDGASLEASDTFFQPTQRLRAPRDGRTMETDDTLLSPISPLEGSTETSRRRFSYES